MQENQTPKQKLNEIYLDFKELETQLHQDYSRQIGQIDNETKILFFCGFQYEYVQELYNHFEDQTILLHNRFIIVVRLKRNSNTSYLINTPYSFGEITNREQILNYCNTKIIMDKLMPSIKDCKFHVIVNFAQLPGNSDQERLNQIKDSGLFDFGKYEIQDKQVSVIIESINNFELSISTSSNVRSDILQFNHILKSQTLRYLFKTNEFFKLNKRKEIDQSYGLMSPFLQNKQDQYIQSIKLILTQFQDQLLLLQQIPFSEDSLEFENQLRLLLNNLNQVFRSNSNTLKDIPYIFSVIRIILSQICQQINSNLKSFNETKLKNFLLQNNVTTDQIKLPSELINQQQINLISALLQKYHKIDYEISDINQINTLRINLNYWSINYSRRIEQCIYKFSQITRQIQDGPSEQINVGVFVFGKSRVGKSTLLNLLKDPTCLTIIKELDGQVYALRKGYESNFRIEHGCVSETQQISGFQIEDIWYYDCPGFDDNRSEEARISHRISLYNYLNQTRTVIGLFLVDVGIRDTQIIKDTFNPIYLLLQDKTQLTDCFNKWSSLILVRTKKKTKNNYLKQWDDAYQGQLEGKYKFYKQMFQDAIEIPKAKKGRSQDEINLINQKIQEKIINSISEKLQNGQSNLRFQLVMDEKLFYLYEIFINALKVKINQIIEILSNQVDDYIMESNDDFTQKKTFIKQLNSFITKQINNQNKISILINIKEWSLSNEAFKMTSQYLYKLIDDILQCFQIEQYFSQNISISPFMVDTNVIHQKIENIIKIIEKLENWERGLKISFFVGTIVASIASWGTFLVAEGAIASAVMGVAARQVAYRIAISASATQIGGLAGANITQIVFLFKKSLLKRYYESYLKEEEQKRLQQQRNQ